MSLYGDGGLIATKPCAASGNYIHKMSDYGKNCRYRVLKRTGDDRCPFKSLYWHFRHRHRGRFSGNPRMTFPSTTRGRESDSAWPASLARTENVLENLPCL